MLSAILGCIPEPRLRVFGPDVGVDAVLDDRSQITSDSGMDGSSDAVDDVHFAQDGSLEAGACGDDAPGRDAFCDGLSAPRLRSPLSSVLTSTGQPRLRWFLPPGVSEVELSICGDRQCSRDVRRYPISGSEFRPPAPLPPGVWFWRVRSRTGPTAQSATWQFVVVGNSSREARWDGLPDLDGDGAADLVVGAPLAEGGEGRVFIYSRSLESPRWTLVPPGGAARGFGEHVSVVGDLDGDGFVELVVRSVSASTPQGVLSVFRGGADGPAPVGVVSPPPARPSEGFGERIERGGDFDGDGFGDWIASTRDFAARTGALLAFRGGPGTLSTGAHETWSVERERYVFPTAIAAVDIDDDGFTDIVATANYAPDRLEAAASHPGLLALVRGAEHGLQLSRVSITEGREFDNSFGATVTVHGDLNADGYPDLLVGNGSSTSGVALVLPGAPSGIPLAPRSTLRFTPMQLESVADFVSGADLSGDGVADIVYEIRTNRGLSVSPVARRILTTVAVGDNQIPFDAPNFPLGAVSASADLTGDGIADLAIGHHEVVDIFAGQTGGPSTTPTLTIRAPVASPSGFGSALAR